jgi:succinate dehydrogenase hydrophobic anchor subunit
MIPALLVLLQVADQTETTFRQPSYFVPVIIALFILGAVLSLVAAVLGFARARAFGASARWFSFAAVCLLLFHLHILVFGFGVVLRDYNIVFAILTFFNAFIILAAFCAIMGFVRLTSPR